MRVVECAEVIAADVFKNADQTRQRITFGDVDGIWRNSPAITRAVRVGAVSWCRG